MTGLRSSAPRTCAHPHHANRLLDPDPDPGPWIRLPARVLARLLRDPRTAARPVGHPGVPAAVRRRMAGIVELALGAG
ncbi:hypothetical protein [Streptomyces sp. NPDC056600]|uniref:hypothetical protein n=1 Tax=Streptomyces sp. NPDC056600 TaxID=3345874 RepID=UPI0036BFBB56